VLKCAPVLQESQIIFVVPLAHVKVEVKSQDTDGQPVRVAVPLIDRDPKYLLPEWL
jgi:hypothetical protein